MARAKVLKILAAAVGVLVLGGAAVAWAMWPEVDEVPEELAEVSAEVSIADLALEAQGKLPAVRIGDLRGKTVFLMIEGRESMTGGEGKLLHRAIHRWQLPDDVVGFSVGDAPAGAVLMREKIENEFLGPMQAEMKLPIYMDYGGSFTSALSLPKGHLGFAIIDAEGELAYRYAGDPGEAELAEIKALLRAEEPAPGPPAPAFTLEGVAEDHCAGRRCALVFLDAKVARSEIPGIEGGFEGDMKESFAQIAKPSVRLARAIASDWDSADRDEVAGAIIGEVEGWEVEGWPVVAEAASAREAFEIGDQAAMVILDEQGRVSFVETGVIPFWKLMLAADLLGIEPKPREDRERE